MKPTKTLIEVQEDYIAKVNAAYARWGHRPLAYKGDLPGHVRRTKYAARQEATRQLMRLGFSEAEARAAVTQADDVAELRRNADE